MSVLVGIVTNPFDPATWEEHHCDDPRELLVSRFASWPAEARIYDLEGFGDWHSAAALIDPSVLSRRDVTPLDERGIDKLATLRGPLMVTIPPADPLTAVIAVVAIAVGVAAAFLLMPRLPSTQRPLSPNNSLAERTNQARPNGRIPDIFGTVESTPDLLAVPYSIFENNREVEIAYMCVGRGQFAISRVRDGDTALASIAGASAAIYGPNTSPNSGSAPQLQIGPAIPEQVKSVVKLNEVNGQTLQPTNLTRVQGEDDIRFVYPDSIETKNDDTDFSEYFSTGDAIQVEGAGDSAPGYFQITTSARFKAGGLIEFEQFSPAGNFAVGQYLTIANAGNVGDNGLGGTIYVELSGTYLITSIAQTRADFSITGSALPAGMTLARASPGTRVNSTGFLVSPAADAPRYDYSPVSPYPFRGLLAEPAGANIHLASQDLTSASWVKSGATAGSAVRLIESNTSANHQVAQTSAFTAGKAYTVSVDAKPAVGVRYPIIILPAATFGSNLFIKFDVAAGTVLVVPANVAAAIEPAPGGGFRCSATATATVTGSATVIHRMHNTSGAGNGSYQGDGAGALDLTNFQLEEGPKATSRIITTTATVTRAAEVIQLDVTAAGIPDGPSSTTYTFDDNSTQTIAQPVSGGLATVPVDQLARPRLRKVSIAGTTFSIGLDEPELVNDDWNRLADFPNGSTAYRQSAFSTATSAGGINLNGSYTIASVSSKVIVLNNPALVNASWGNVEDLPGGATGYGSPTISRNSESWVGPYIVDLDGTSQVVANLVGMNGLYLLSKSKGKQSQLAVGYALELTPVNANDAAIGPAELFEGVIIGSSTERTTVGFSVYASPTFTGRCAVRMRRTTGSPPDGDYSAVVDEVKWRDCFGLAPIQQADFGDVTTVMTRTVATPGALSLKARKLNMRVTRMLPQRVSGSTFGPLVATDSADDIIAAACLDPLIGRRSPEEVDFDNLYATIAEVKAYFGSELAAEFGYTFDDDDVSFEETLATITQAIFCMAYRQGRMIRFNFERATNVSALIFNARNTLPGSQKRQNRFGLMDDHDGVELEYSDPEDGAQLTISLPLDGSAISPRAVEVKGVRSYPLAYWQARRADNKLKHQNITVELEATQEAALVIPTNRVLIADMTRPNILAGEVEQEDGRTLMLSDKAALAAERTWTIFLQHVDATVEALGVEAWVPPAGQASDPYKVTLARAPRMALSIDDENFARATYMIVPDDDVQTRAFLITEREPASNFTETVRAINYTFLYYQHDELVLWLDFGTTGFADSGPYQENITPVGEPSLVVSPARGDKLVFSAANTNALVTTPVISPVSYTKAAWVRPDNAAVNGDILGVTATGEMFGFNGAGQLRAGHGSTQVSAAMPAAGQWHHVAVAYEADTQAMTLYIDGLLVDEATAVARGARGTLSALIGLVGQYDDVRLWKRGLLPDEIRAVCLGGRIVT